MSRPDSPRKVDMTGVVLQWETTPDGQPRAKLEGADVTIDKTALGQYAIQFLGWSSVLHPSLKAAQAAAPAFMSFVLTQRPPVGEVSDE